MRNYLKKKKKKISPSPLENKWKLFPILFNSRIKKKLSENYFSPLNVISKAKLTIRQSFSTINYSLTYREKGWRVFEYSRTYDDICSKIIPIIFAFRKAIYDVHLLVSSPLVVSSRDREKRDEEREEEGKNNHTGQSVVPLTVEK